MKQTLKHKKNQLSFSTSKEKHLANNPKDAVAHAYNHAEYLKQWIEIIEWWADYVECKKEMRLIVGGIS